MNGTKTIASDELLTEQLTNRDWDKFWLRLMGRCAWLLRKRYEVKWPNDELKGFSRDAISEVINQIFIKKSRKWNVDHYLDFEDFIIGAIDSHINNMLNLVVKEIQLDEKKPAVMENFDNVNIEQVIIGKELKEAICAELQELGASDDELLIFECLGDGIVKPDHIRSTLSLTEEEFHNAWRRFKRKREAIKAKLAAHGY